MSSPAANVAMDGGAGRKKAKRSSSKKVTKKSSKKASTKKSGKKPSKKMSKKKKSTKRGGGVFIPGAPMHKTNAEKAAEKAEHKAKIEETKKKIAKVNKLHDLEKHMDSLLSKTVKWQRDEIKFIVNEIEPATKNLIKMIKEDNRDRVAQFFYNNKNKVQRLRPLSQKSATYQAAPSHDPVAYQKNAKNRANRLKDIIKYAIDEATFRTAYEELESKWVKFIAIKDEHALEKVEEGEKLQKIIDDLLELNVSISEIRKESSKYYDEWISKHNTEGTWLKEGSAKGFFKYLSVSYNRV